MFGVLRVKIWESSFYCLLMCLKTVRWVASNVDLDQMPHFVASDLGLHCLLRPASVYMQMVNAVLQILWMQGKGPDKTAWMCMITGSFTGHIQSNLNTSNMDGSFTMANSNSFFSPYKFLLLAWENKYLRKFSYFTMTLYVVCRIASSVWF